MKTITVNLPDEYVANVEDRLAKGEYGSWDEAMAIAVAEWLFELEQPPMVDEDEHLRSKIRESLDQYAQGRYVDGEEYMERLEREFEERMANTVKAP